MADLLFEVIDEDSTVDVVIDHAVIDVSAIPDVVSVVTVGGPPGAQGPAGDGGITYVQASPAATWTITNTLGRKPASVSIWLADELVDTTIETPDLSTIVVTFAAPQSGRAEII